MRGPRFKDDDEIMEYQGSVNDPDKPKKKAPRRKIKNKLVETFPSYLQVRTKFSELSYFFCLIFLADCCSSKL